MKKVLFADFLFALLLLLLVEAVARLCFPHDVSGRFSYGYDPEAGFVASQGGQVHLVRAGGRRFHPQQFSFHRPAETVRIMVLGDSVPRGPSLQAAYAHQVQEILQAQGIRAEVINLAVAGFGVRRTELVLQKILHYDPSLIILHLNDSNEYEDEREFRRSQDFAGWHPRHWLMKSFIFARAYELKTEKILWRLLPDQIRLRNAVNDADAEIRASLDQAKQEEWQQRVREKTRDMVALARNRDIPVILVTQAVRGAPQDRLDDHGLDALARSLAGPGVYPVSMTELFAAQLPITTYFADSAHLTPTGHRLLAAALADVINRRLGHKIDVEKRAGGS